jgi:hypothetical protein
MHHEDAAAPHQRGRVPEQWSGVARDFSHADDPRVRRRPRHCDGANVGHARRRAAEQGVALARDESYARSFRHENVLGNTAMRQFLIRQPVWYGEESGCAGHLG